MNAAAISLSRRAWLRGALALRQLSYECHVLAAFHALPSLRHHVRAHELAGLTALCFGFDHVPRDRARLIVPNIPPLEATARALAIVGVRVRGADWAMDEADAAWRDLARQTESAPVVVGPLDMGLLSHQPLAAIYRGLDHCMVALAVRGENVLLSDSEGFPVVNVAREEFLPAWRAASVPEARRSFHSLQLEIGALGRNAERERDHLLEMLDVLRPSSALDVADLLERIAEAQSETSSSGLELNLAALLERACCTLQLTCKQSGTRFAVLSDALIELIAGLGSVLGPPLTAERRAAALRNVGHYFEQLSMLT